jgi:hypothetical protein
MTGVLGMVYAVGDAYGSGSTPVSLGRFALAFSVASSGCSVPTYSKDSPTVLDWSSWALNLTAALLNILGSVNFSAGTSAKFGLTELSPGLLSGLSIGQILVLGLMFDNADYGEARTNPKGDAELGLEIATQLAGLINPLKLESELGAAVVAGVDLIMGFAGMVATFLSL